MTDADVLARIMYEGPEANGRGTFDEALPSVQRVARERRSRW